MAAALIALAMITITLTLTLRAILNGAPVVEDLMNLSRLLLSWPIVAGGFVFGGGQAIIGAWNKGHPEGEV